MSYWRIKEAIRRFRPDVVHTHSAKGGMLGRAAAWSLGRAGGDPHGPRRAVPSVAGQGARWFFQACERWAAKRCHAIVSVADAMTDLMVAAGVAPREKFTTIYSGMEVEPFLRSAEHRQRVRRELGYRPEHVVIGKIARLFKLKGHDDVIEAARGVIDGRCPECPLSLCAATASFGERLERQIAAAGLAEPFPIHRPGSARADSRADRGDGHRGPRQSAGRACPRAAPGVDLPASRW